MTIVQSQQRLDMTARLGPRFGVGTDSRRIRRVSAIILCWFLFNASPKALSLNAEGAEYPLKLAFLYNFAKFVEWPAESFRSPDAICIVGHNPFSPDIENELRSRPAGDHPVEFVALKPTDALNACQIVWLLSMGTG